METPLFGNYRAKVVDNRDPKKCGRVKLWIPDIMPQVEESKGLWAWPANNPTGGRNMENESDGHYMGSSMIPKKGGWTFCFFEAGNVNRPYYFGALDIEHPIGEPSVLPENQLGEEYEHKWTVFKSHDGRTIVVSDDPEDCRLELTGKKRLIKQPPHGDLESVYKVDDNQTVILLDEREGKEKLLIRTYKGDFLHIDIDEQKLQAYFKNDIVLKTDGSMHITCGQNFIKNVLLVDSNTVGGAKLTTVGGMYNVTTIGPQNYMSLIGNINMDAMQVWIDSGKAIPAIPLPAANPEGERDT